MNFAPSRVVLDSKPIKDLKESLTIDVKSNTTIRGYYPFVDSFTAGVEKPQMSSKFSSQRFLRRITGMAFANLSSYVTFDTSK